MTIKKIEIRIRQRKDDCHYETIIEMDGTTFIGYGTNQQIADTDCINKLLFYQKQEIAKEVDRIMNKYEARVQGGFIIEVREELKQELIK